MRAITAVGLAELFAQNSSHAFLCLATFTHATLPTPIRLVNNKAAIVYGGNTFTPLAFDLALAVDAEDQVPSLTLTVDNVDQRFIELIRSITDKPSVKIEVVRVNEAGTVILELGPMDFMLNGSQMDSGKVDLTLGFESDILNQSATQDIFSPSVSPGLFA